MLAVFNELFVAELDISVSVESETPPPPTHTHRRPSTQYTLRAREQGGYGCCAHRHVYVGDGTPVALRLRAGFGGTVQPTRVQHRTRDFVVVQDTDSEAGPKSPAPLPVHCSASDPRRHREGTLDACTAVLAVGCAQLLQPHGSLLPGTWRGRQATAI